MRMLIKIRKSPERKFLVHIPTEELSREIQRLLKMGKKSKAAKIALEKGKVLLRIPAKDPSPLPAKIILTETTVHYDLM